MAVVVIITQFVILPILMMTINLQLVVLLVVAGFLRWGLVSSLWLAVLVGMVVDIVEFGILGVHSLWLVATVAITQIIDNWLLGDSLSMRVFAQTLVVFVSSFVGVVISNSALSGAISAAISTSVIGSILIFKINAKK